MDPKQTPGQTSQPTPNQQQPTVITPGSTPQAAPSPVQEAPVVQTAPAASAVEATPNVGTASAPQQPSPQQVGHEAVVGAQSAASNGQGKAKKLILAGVMSLALLVGAGSYYLFAYLPNTPNNVWRRGMASVGVGLEEIVADGFEQDLSNTDLVGSIEITSPVSAKIDLSGNYDSDGSGALDFDADVEEWAEKLAFDMIYSASDVNLPKIYFKTEGMQSLVQSYLGGYGLGSSETVLDSQWWLIDFQEIIDTGYVSQEDIDDVLLRNTSGQVSQADYQKLVEAALEATNEYVFTADTDNMVIGIDEFIAKEDFEGVESHKYTAQLDRTNMKLYGRAVRDNLAAAGAQEIMGLDKQLEEYMSDADIDEWVDDLDLTNTEMYVWVDSDKKVMRNLRISEDGTDLDVSILLGDDESVLPIRTRVTGGGEGTKGSYSATVTYDLNNNKTSYVMDVNIVDTATEEPYIVMKGSMEMSGNSEGAKPILPVESEVQSVFVALQALSQPATPAPSYSDYGSTSNRALDAATLSATISSLAAENNGQIPDIETVRAEVGQKLTYYLTSEVVDATTLTQSLYELGYVKGSSCLSDALVASGSGTYAVVYATQEDPSNPVVSKCF